MEGLGHCLSKKVHSKWVRFGRETGSGLLEEKWIFLFKTVEVGL